MTVPFADLDLMHGDLRAELDAALGEVISSGAFVLGPAVERFEAAFAASVGRRHCIGVNSGTSALHLALLAAGVGPGDEVVTTPHTFIATTWAISYCGATPVFADVDRATGNLDPDRAAERISPRTAALLPVDLYGNPADLLAFEALAERHGIPLIDDSCQAHGSRLVGRPVGSFGQAACFSFYPGKNLGALGEGGAVVTDDDDAAARIRQLRNHAQTAASVHSELGFNYRMEGLQGAALGVKLPHLERWNDLRRTAAARYEEVLADTPGVTLPSVTAQAEPNWHLYVVRVGRREEVAASMRASGIDVRYHYPSPVHLQPAYADLRPAVGDLSEAEAFAAECLSLPMFPGITPEQQDLVAEALRAAVAEAA